MLLKKRGIDVSGDRFANLKAFCRYCLRQVLRKLLL
jgi:hypothetical protein